MAAVVVYFAIGSRQEAAPPGRDERLDPKAILESTAAVLQQVRKGEEDFELSADRTLTYDDGSARMMGIRILENFDTPYISQSFTEFWRRWHISLSTWIRDYLYIPLGGNRHSEARQGRRGRGRPQDR